MSGRLTPLPRGMSAGFYNFMRHGCIRTDSGDLLMSLPSDSPPAAPPPAPVRSLEPIPGADPNCPQCMGCGVFLRVWPRPGSPDGNQAYRCGCVKVTAPPPVPADLVGMDFSRLMNRYRNAVADEFSETCSRKKGDAAMKIQGDIFVELKRRCELAPRPAVDLAGAVPVWLTCARKRVAETKRIMVGSDEHLLEMAISDYEELSRRLAARPAADGTPDDDYGDAAAHLVAIVDVPELMGHCATGCENCERTERAIEYAVAQVKAAYPDHVLRLLAARPAKVPDAQPEVRAAAEATLRGDFSKGYIGMAECMARFVLARPAPETGP